MIEIEAVRAENFLAYEEVNVSLVQRGLILILGVNKDTSGSNGAGKSCLLDVVSYAFYERGRYKTKDHYVNSATGKKGFLVEVDFKHDGKPYTRRVAYKHHKHKSKSEIIDREKGKDITPKQTMVSGKPKRTVTATYFASLIGTPFSIFEATVYSRQKAVHDFVFGTDLDRQTFFAKMFGFEVWRDSQNLANKKITPLEKELAGVAGKLEMLQSENLEDVTLDPGEIQKQVDALGATRDDLVAAIADLEGQQRSLDARIGKANRDVATLSERHSQAQQRQSIVDGLEAKKEELAQAEAALPAVAFNLEQVTQQVTSILAAADAEIARLDKQAQELRASHEAVCPTCRRSLTGEEKQGILADIQRDRQVQDGKKAESRPFQAQIAEIRKRKAACDTLRSEVENTHIPEIGEVDMGALATLRGEIEEMTRLMGESQAVLSEKRQALQEASTQQGQLSAQVQQARDAKQRLGSREQQLAGYENDHERLSREVALLKTAVKDVFPGIRMRKIQSLLSVLNQQVQTYLSLLSSGLFEASYEFTVRGQSEVLDLLVGDPFKGVKPIEGWSGGESKRVVVATMFAVWKVAGSLSKAFDLVAFDEVLADVDPLGYHEVFNVLQSIRDTGRTVMLTTNAKIEDLDLDLFDEVWVSVRERGVTRLVSIEDVEQFQSLRAA